MKETNKILALLYVFIASCIMMSCSNNAEYGSLESANKEAVVTNSDLIKQLMSYNDSILNTRPKTRGAKTFATVALNDVVGAYVGGKVGANIGSKVGTILGSPVPRLCLWSCCRCHRMGSLEII